MDQATRAAFLRTIRGSYERRVTVTIRNRDERPLDALRVSGRLVAGEIMGDTRQDVTRSLSLGLADPEGKLRFEGDSPAEGAMFADRFVSVEWGAFVPELDQWVDVDVFWGPVTAFNRDGHLVTIEAQGKEHLMLDPHLATESYTLNKGLRIDEAIRRVARRAGERRFDLPEINRRLAQPRVVRADAEPWKVIKGGEQDAKGKRIPGLIERAPGNRYIYYDGAGRLTTRPRNQNVNWIIRDDRDLLEPPDVSYDSLDSDVVNTVIVRGREPDGKGKKRATSGPVSLPDGHPLSPHRLRRNGQPRYRTRVVETELKSNAECRERAKQELRRHSQVGADADLRILPNPLIKELDVVRLATEEYDFTFPVRHYILPLGEGAMTVSTRRRVGKRMKARRRFRFEGGAVIDRQFKGGSA